MSREELVIATNNDKKFLELKRILERDSNWIPVQASKLEPPFTDYPEESAETFHGNALIKASAAAKVLHRKTLADDSGLIVPALGGQPGVYSARYGKEGFDDEERNEFLLRELRSVVDRYAYFETVLVITDERGEELASFSGKMEGEIALRQHGLQGFGYDPIFIPTGFDQTLAELGAQIKDKISHRKEALIKFIAFS